MQKRKIRKHQSGTANYTMAQSVASLGQTYHDQMKKTITQTMGKQFPSINNKYVGQVSTDTRGLTMQKNPPTKAQVFSTKYQSSQSVKEKRDSYKNKNSDMQEAWLNSTYTGNQKLVNIQKLLRRRYANRSKMFNIFNGWDGQPKGYIDYQNLRSVLGFMGINLTDQQSKQFINMYSNNNSNKLNLNDFLNVIYTNQPQQSNIKKQLPQQQTPMDPRFRINFVEQEGDCSKVRMESVNSLGSYQLEKAMTEGQKLKNRLQKHIKSSQEAQKLLFTPNSGSVITFDSIKNGLIRFLKDKQESVKWKQLQGFLSLFQYNIKCELDKETLCKSIFENNYANSTQITYRNPPPVSIHQRQAKSIYEPSVHNINIPKCLKKLDEQIFRGSSSSKNIFQQFDKDHDGFVSEVDFMRLMKQRNLLSEQQSREIFGYIGGNNSQHEKCMKYDDFVQQIKAGMGTNSADQYPNFLRPKKINQFRAQQKLTKSSYFDPRSTLSVDQRKTRFNATPNYHFSSLGLDGTRFWGKSGDLNAKVAFQKQEKNHLHAIQKNKLDVIASNRWQDSVRRDSTNDFQDNRVSTRLQTMWTLKNAYQKSNHSGLQ